MRSVGAPVSVVLLTAVSACIHEAELVPGPEANVVPGSRRAAIGEAAGLRVTVQSGVWSGDPPDLKAYVTPLEIKLDNAGDRRVRILYSEFGLVTQDGYRMAALPPYNLRSEPSSRMDPEAPQAELVQYRRHFGHRHFSYAPYWAPYYPGYPLWSPAPYVWDWPYYDTYYRAWPKPLPTEDMITKALPEGALDPGGYVQGFVYFPALRSGNYDVTFTMTVTDAETNQRVDTVRIPFRVR